MLVHYLKFFFRDIVRNRLYAFINLTGLVIGLALTFLLLLYVFHELTYDKTNKNYARVYRVISHEVTLNRQLSQTPYPLSSKLKQQFPDIEEAAVVQGYIHPNVKIGEEQVQVNDFFCADNAILRILTFPIVEGNSLSPLENPESIILGKEWSKRIFGNESPIGKTIELSVGNDKYTLTVTALMDALPNNRTFIPGMIANINIALENLHKTINTSDTITRDAAYFRTSYDDWWFDSYLLLKEGANYKDLEKRLLLVAPSISPRSTTSMKFFFNR